MKKIRLIIEFSILALLTIFLLWVNLKNEIYNSIYYYQSYIGEEYSEEFKEMKKELRSQLGIKYLELGYKSQEIINAQTILDYYYVFINCEDNNISYEDAYNVINNCSDYISEKSTKYNFLKDHPFKITIRLPSPYTGDVPFEECTFIGTEKNNKLYFNKIIFENVKKDFFNFKFNNSEYIQYILGQPLFSP
ncbi:MAG TPA: hypothetical protein PKI60_05945, partial [Oscillospiraceae bacterium]|nr:hypothetical protein [Oscillospiraceae bacterium]